MHLPGLGVPERSEEFAKARVNQVRDAAMMSSDAVRAAPECRSPRRRSMEGSCSWRELGGIFASVVIPDVVDETIFQLLRAIDQGSLKIHSPHLIESPSIYLRTNLENWQVGTWVAVVGERCIQKNDLLTTFRTSRIAIKTLVCYQGRANRSPSRELFPAVQAGNFLSSPRSTPPWKDERSTRVPKDQ